MSRFLFKKKTLFVLLLVLLPAFASCGKKEAEDNVIICDLSGFSAASSTQSEQMEELYLYIVEKSTVKQTDSKKVEKLADNLEDFYVKLVSQQLEEYNSQGHDASFEEMLHFLFQMESREDLRFFVEKCAENEIRNRLIIEALADKEKIELTDEEYESLKSQVQVSSYFVGDEEQEIRYELLRRKLLQKLLEKLK